MNETQVFHITESTSQHGWFALLMVLAVVIFLAAMALAVYSVYGAKNARFEVSTEGLRIRAGLYGRLIPFESLDLDQARPVDLNEDSEYSPRRRRSGSSLPGLKAGWFKMRNGEKGYCFLTDMSRVAYVPTSEGYSVLLSVDDPVQFIETLRQAAQGG